jgi:hypothetical protein
MQKKNYHTIIDAISDLQERGFFLDFSLIGNQLFCAQEKCYFGAEEFDVLEMYTFHIDGHTRDETVVYAIESFSRPLKGILLNSGYPILTSVPIILSRKIRKFWRYV